MKKEIESESAEKKIINRKKISQADIPTYTLSKALRIASAIYENFGKDPVKPLRIAQALNVSPSSSYFRMQTGAAIAYGLTDGGYNSAQISLTPLARRILCPTPTIEGDDLAAKREATLKPRILGLFLDKYNDAPLPSDTIACNVLEDMGVPKERASQILNIIKESAQEVGFLVEIKGKLHVDLQGNLPGKKELAIVESDSEITIPERDIISNAEAGASNSITCEINKVFITHGKNQSFLEPIKKLLAFGGFEPIVATEKQTVSQPVPDKVMDSMRTCGAAIIHIDAEQKLLNAEAKECIVLNPNVLIEIGAAMALYGKRFILLVKDGIELPSNLQGLYQVRYSGDTLNSDVTIKLLEAINDIKSHSIPN